MNFFVTNHALVQDWSLDLLASSPVQYSTDEENVLKVWQPFRARSVWNPLHTFCEQHLLTADRRSRTEQCTQVTGVPYLVADQRDGKRTDPAHWEVTRKVTHGWGERARWRYSDFGNSICGRKRNGVQVILRMNEWCFRPKFCTVRLYWAGANWANEMNFVMNHARGAGLITRPVDQQSSMLPLYHGYPLLRREMEINTQVFAIVVVVEKEKPEFKRYREWQTKIGRESELGEWLVF